MKNPRRRSLLRLFLGVSVGVVFMTGLVSVVVAFSLVRGLPDDPLSVQEYRSLHSSRLLAGDGRVVATFPLVESVEPLSADATLLVEAFLALQPGSFYEARVRRALVLPSVVARAWRGEAPEASPLSVEVASALTASRPPTRMREVRVALLAARLDAGSELHARTTAYLQTVPLCRGRRGIVEALRECLGVEPGDRLEAGEAAFLAASAGFGLDLAEDPDRIQAAAEGVLDRLTLQRRIDAERTPEVLETTSARARAVRPRLGGDPLVVATTEEVRRRYGMLLEPRPVSVFTTVQPNLQADFASRVELRGGAWVVLDPRSRAIVALGGDPKRVLPEAPELVAPLIGDSTNATVAQLAGALLVAAERLAGRQDDGSPLGPVRVVAVEDRNLEPPGEPPLRPRYAGSAEDAWLYVNALGEDGRVRITEQNGLVVFAHPAVVGILLLGSEADGRGPLPPGLIPPDAQEHAFSLPDGLWADPDGVVRRRGR